MYIYIYIVCVCGVCVLCCMLVLVLTTCGNLFDHSQYVNVHIFSKQISFRLIAIERTCLVFAMIIVHSVKPMCVYL